MALKWAANLECLHAGLNDRNKDGFALVGVCKHIRDLVQEAVEETGLWFGQNLHVTLFPHENVWLRFIQVKRTQMSSQEIVLEIHAEYYLKLNETIQ